MVTRSKAEGDSIDFNDHHSKRRNKSRGASSTQNMQLMMDAKFKELDAFLNKKVLGQISDLSIELRTRISSVENTVQESERSLKRATVAKMAKMQ